MEVEISVYFADLLLLFADLFRETDTVVDLIVGDSLLLEEKVQ